MTEKDISIAKDSWVILEERFSKTTKSTYLANICPSCNMFTWSFPLTEHIIDTLHWKDYKKIRSWYSCLNCEEV